MPIERDGSPVTMDPQDLDDPRTLALGALDGAEYHAQRAPDSTKVAVKVTVWCTAAIVYAILQVAKAAAAPRRAK